MVIQKMVESTVSGDILRIERLDSTGASPADGEIEGATEGATLPAVP